MQDSIHFLDHLEEAKKKGEEGGNKQVISLEGFTANPNRVHYYKETNK